MVHAGLLTDVHGHFFYALFPHRGKEKKGTQLNVSWEIRDLRLEEAQGGNSCLVKRPYEYCT